MGSAVVGSSHDRLIEKAKNRARTCGSDGRCIVYGTTQVTRPTNQSRDVWHDIAEDNWAVIFPIPGLKGIRRPSFSIETIVQNGNVESDLRWAWSIISPLLRMG